MKKITKLKIEEICADTLKVVEKIKSLSPISTVDIISTATLQVYLDCIKINCNRISIAVQGDSI